ncbi:MAG TPA: antibiotic biosynthesis monooxygenase family protein [Candidatus Dormibacteraeota bacterium]
MSVRFINLFECPGGRDEQFVDLWQQVNAHMAAKPGYRSHRLHRALSDNARYRYINYAVWESTEDWQNAHDETFRALVSDPAWAEFPSTPTLCEVVHEGHNTMTGEESADRS